MGSKSNPWACSLACNSLSASTFAAASCRRATMAVGVPAGDGQAFYSPVAHQTDHVQRVEEAEGHLVAHHRVDALRRAPVRYMDRVELGHLGHQGAGQMMRGAVAAG